MTDPAWDAEASLQERNQPASVSTSPSDPGHRDVRSRLSDYLDGSLSPADRRAIQAHLDRCPDCRNFANTLRTTIHALDTLAAKPAPEAAKQRVLDRVKSESLQA
jgi:anti-sigma factor RsiW